MPVDVRLCKLALDRERGDQAGCILQCLAMAHSMAAAGLLSLDLGTRCGVCNATFLGDGPEVVGPLCRPGHRQRECPWTRLTWAGRGAMGAAAGGWVGQLHPPHAAPRLLELCRTPAARWRESCWASAPLLTRWEAEVQRPQALLVSLEQHKHSCCKCQASLLSSRALLHCSF